MSPGPVTSRQHGGHGFGRHFHGYGHHGHGYGRNVTAAPRDCSAAHQRFSVTPSEGGGSNITLDENEIVTVGTDADGNVTVVVNPKPPENGNGIGQRGTNGIRRRGLFGHAAEKMAVSSNSDGSITIRPEGDGTTLQIVGDPLSGAVTVVELVPEPLNTPNSSA